MSTNVYTDGKALVTQYARGTVSQPADPVFIKPKSDPGVAPHNNNSSVIKNAAGTVYDHKTQVAHSESYLGAGKHAPIVIKGQITGKLDGDNGFLSFMKNVYIEGRNAVMHEVETAVNAAWSMLPPAIKNIVQNGGAIAGGLSTDDFANAAKADAEAMLDAIKSTDTLIALAQTAALMGVSAIPVVGQLAGGAAVAMRVKSAVESVSGAAEELKAMMDRWSQPMSPEQLAAERQKLASWVIRVGIAVILAALGKAMAKLSNRSTGKQNSTKSVNTNEKEQPKSTACACKTPSPVIIATGEKSLTQNDFQLPGYIPLDWTRNYRSGDTRSSWFGQGWNVPLAVQLALSADGINYYDAGGRSVSLPTIALGTEFFEAYEQFTLKRSTQDDWEIVFKDGISQHFQRVREDLFALPLCAISDRNGNRISFDYPAPPEDPFDPWRPHSITDSVGRVLYLKWNGLSLLSDISLRVDPIGPLQHIASYQYSDTGDLLSHIDANGAQRQYEWRNHVLVGYTEPDGARYCAEYDEYSPSGRVTRSYAAADGRGLHFVYDDRACATRITDELGRSTIYEYDARKDIIATTGPDGIRVETPFDSNGHPRGSIDPLGRQSFFQFDRRGNLTALVDASGARTSIDYNGLDLPIKLTDALQHVWHRDYDPRGNLVTVTDPLAHTTSYTYDSQGQPICILDARGGSKQLQWDQAGNLVAYVDCSGNSTRFTYDMLGRLLTRTDALGHTTHYDWDTVGRLISMTEPGSSNGDENQASHYYQWSAEGRLLRYTDPLGATTTYTYNSHGEPVQRIDANGHTLDYSYDAVGRLISLTNENGDSSYFGYDIADQLTDETGFDGRHQRYCYNAAGELTHLVEAGGSQFGPGKVTHFERDALGRLVAKHAEDDTSCHSQFTYDALGRLTSANNPAAQLAFAYDPIGQLLSESQSLSGGTTKLFKHRYDELGNRIQSTLPDQRSLHWLFYGSGHLHQINLAQPEQSTQHQVIADMERDALHREIKRSQGSLESRYDYDPMGRLTRHKAALANGRSGLSVGREATIGVERSYRYDLVGNLSSQVDSLRGKQDYRYDPTGRILATTGRLDEVFAFDPAGNLQNSQTGPTSKVRGNRLTVYQDLRFEYDIHGNVIERKKGAHETALFTWNADHQLSASTVTRHGVTQSTNYEYDALGRRTRKIDAFGATEYLWDGDLMIHSQRGNKASLFVFEPNSFVPLATIQDESTYWYQCDQIGAPQELTDQAGEIIWAADYKVWGEAKVRDVALKTGTDNWSSTPSYGWTTSANATPIIDQPFRFQGQQFDEETGLHYNRFRYYDPAIGRFVSEDPIGLAGGWNLFVYAENPIIFIDPFGLSSAKLDKAMSGRKKDCHQAHHLIPEEVMKDPAYKKMFDKLKGMGFDPDGAGNGIHLPDNQQLAQATGLPGHWSNHDQYTSSIKGQVDNLYKDWKRGSVSDTQLALGVKDIQKNAKQGLESGQFQISPKCRLL